MKTAIEVKQASHCLFSILPDDNYQFEYPYFVGFFAKRDELGLEELVIGSNMIYGWMPTIMKLKSREFAPALDALNKAKRGEMLQDEELMSIASVVNNSLVGTSKLLHFINPNLYPIWDSRVCHWLFGEKSSFQVKRVDKYRSYIKLCHRLASDEEFLDLVKQFEQHIGYAVTPIRVAELIMFISAKDVQTSY